jgi:integrase/recombinase XerD
MQAVPKVHTIHLVPRSDLADEIREFLIDREARALSKCTIAWYRQQLGHLRAFLDGQGITSVEHITSSLLRSFILGFQKTHNPGGTHGVHRAARAFLNWYAIENEGWRNPMAKVAAPKVPEQPMEPVDTDDLKAMLATCERRTFTGDRDKALMLFLLDSGCRRAEFCALNIADVNLSSGAVLVRHGKGSKWRTAFIGAKTRRALIAYLRHLPRSRDAMPLWLNERGGRLSFTALRAILVRRAKLAGVPAPSPHSFRRGFAIATLRNGCDLITLQRLLGHSSLAIVSRYLRQVEGDLRAAHEKAGPVDNML